MHTLASAPTSHAPATLPLAHLAGITATLVCFPLDVLRTRMMAPGGHKYGGPFKTLHGIMKFEGVSALYSGV